MINGEAVAWILGIFFVCGAVVIGSWGLARIICDYKLKRAQIGSGTVSRDAKRADSTRRSAAK